MLTVFLLVLSAFEATTEAADLNGLRKPRQLDLGLQDIRTADDELLTTVGLPSSSKDGLINGYLPPVPSSSPSEIVSAQSQQTFDFKSANSVEKESELCKSPFGNEACNFKSSSESDLKPGILVPKPSRDLVPPFKDVDQELAIKATTLSEQVKRITTTTTTKPQKLFSSTTEKPATKFFKHEPNRKFTRIKPTTLRSRVVGNKAEATNELRSYLPPEFSAAAQTNVAVVQPSNRNNDHDSDHHGHHHGDNFNICADAFHSFLCAPLKARKRITGALPTRLLAESSFINYQKTLANFDRETAPSNGFKNEYLPPNLSSTNLVHSTYLPPFTTSRPVVTTLNTPRPYSAKIIPESSNLNDKVYLPPVTDTVNSSPPRFTSSSTEYSITKFTTPTLTTTPAPVSTPAPSTVKVSKTTKDIVSNSFFQNNPTVQTTFNSASPTIPVFDFLPSNENTYLPPNLSLQPSSSFTTNSKSLLSVTSTSLPSSSSFASVPQITFGSLPPNSIILSQKPKVQPTLPVFTSTSSFTSTSKSPILSSSFVPQPSNSKDSYLPPVTQFQLSSGPSTTTIKPYSSTMKSAEEPSLPSNSIISSQKPKVQPTLPVFTATSSFTSTSKSPILSPSFASQQLDSKNSYLPPITQFQLSSGPSTTTIKPYSSTLKSVEKPSNTDLSYLPPDNKEPAAAQISSAAVAAPQTNNPFHHGRDLCTDPFHSFLCASAKPRKKITGEFPLGFKSENSNTEELRLKPESSNQGENKVRPDQSFVDASAENNGYKYAKPVNLLPSNVVRSTIPSLIDYSYSKPDKTFSSSSHQDRFISAASTKKPEPVLRPSEAKVLTGYQYPKPNKTFSLPGAQENTKIVTTTTSPTTGYTYPRPQKPFPLPTEQKEVRQKPKQKTSPSSQPNIPLPTNQARGYQYPKPDQSLNLPDRKGYSYPKPEKQLELPGESRSKSVLPQSNFDLNGLGNLGSADFIPVNKVEFKRAESSKLLAGLRRFGERMKKRERQAQLLKRQLH